MWSVTQCMWSCPSCSFIRPRLHGARDAVCEQPTYNSLRHWITFQGNSSTQQEHWTLFCSTKHPDSLYAM